MKVHPAPKTAKVSKTATSEWHTQSDEEEDDLDAALMQMLDAAADGGDDGDVNRNLKALLAWWDSSAATFLFSS